jgi:hypothetical protein
MQGKGEGFLQAIRDAGIERLWPSGSGCARLSSRYFRWPATGAVVAPKIVKREGGGIWPIANRPQVDNLPYSGLFRRFFEVTALEQASCVAVVDSAGISSVMEFITAPGDRAAHHNRPPLQEL